jgi:hypothetical protein
VGRLSIVGLLLLTILDQLLLIMQAYIYYFTKLGTLMRRSTVQLLPFQLVFPALWRDIIALLFNLAPKKISFQENGLFSISRSNENCTFVSNIFALLFKHDKKTVLMEIFCNEKIYYSTEHVLKRFFLS